MEESVTNTNLRDYPPLNHLFDELIMRGQQLAILFLVIAASIKCSIDLV